jgi:hypothetical protein
MLRGCLQSVLFRLAAIGVSNPTAVMGSDLAKDHDAPLVPLVLLLHKHLDLPVIARSRTFYSAKPFPLSIA